MESLNEQQKNQLHAVLVPREEALREDIRCEVDLQDGYVQLASEVPDPGDLSFANLSIDLGNAAVTRDLTELRAIELTNKKLASGTYGECISYCYPISFERLMAMSATERCAPCQENYERTHHDGMKDGTL